MKLFSQNVFNTLGLACVLTFGSPTQAHFLWIASQPDGPASAAIVFFGEDVQDRTYHLPEGLAELKLVHRTTNAAGESPVALTNVDTDELVGLVSTKPVPADGLLETVCEYGVYHGTLLTYYAKHYLSDAPDSWPVLGPSSRLDLDGVPSWNADQSRLTINVTWKGKPISNVGVSLRQGDDEPLKSTTNSAGKAEFPISKDGLASILIQFTDPESSGHRGDVSYDGAMYCTTITFPVRRALHSQPAASNERVSMAVPPLPIAIASFGAVVSDGWLYVYGGHMGEEHEHSRDNLADQFVRVSLEQPARWESLPMQTPVQGVALVAHEGMIYRIGGMTADNAVGEPDELHSLTEFARFDPSTRQWTNLPPLPEGRSSHDAVVVGDTIYVLGGWELNGDDDGKWHPHGLTMRLDQPKLAWSELPQLSFQRRALAVTALEGKILVIGGMDADGEVTRRVDAFDPLTGVWRSLAPLPGKGMNGFGAAAWNHHGVVYASGSDGTLYRLRSLDDSWQPVAQLDQPRFFHRLVPRDDTTLLGIAGASMKGHLSDTEEIELVR